MKIIRSIGLLLGAVTAFSAIAETALEEIVVTAQRREQSLQEVPVSVTAFTGDAIERRNIKGAADYLAMTPNVSFTEDGQAGSRGLGISVRGVNNLVSGENAVVNSIGVYLDGFSVASVPTQVSNPFLPDMERLEVLRGPQGTYFGRNAVGGALNMATRNPTDEFGWKVLTGGESYKGANQQYNVMAIVNLPASDTFGLRGLAYYEESGGLVDNICGQGANAASCPTAGVNGFTPNGANDSGHEHLNLRLKGLWDMSADTQVALTLIYADEDQGHDENVPSGIMDLDTVDSFGIQTAIDPGTGFWPNNRNKLSHDLEESNSNETSVAILNISHQLNEAWALKSTTGIVKATQKRRFDNDGVGGLDGLGRINQYEGSSWSTELRAEGSFESMDLVLGAIYSRDRQEQKNNVHVSTGAELGHVSIGGVGILPPFPDGLGLLLNSKNHEVTGIAVFGDVTYHLTDSLDLIAGGRFSRDDVENDLRAFGIDPTCCFPGSPGFPGGPGFDFFNSFANSARPLTAADKQSTDFAPRVGARYQVNPDVSVYGIVSKGYKAGGASVGNNTNATGSPAFNVAFDKEQLWNYELGFKTEFADRRVRVNGSAFRLAWSDLQFESFRFLTPGDLSTNFEQTVNIDKAKATGFELEVLALPANDLTLSASLGWLDTEITQADLVELTGGFQVDLKGLELPKAPKLTASLAGEYRWKLADNDAWVRLEYIRRDGQYSDIEGLTNKQTRGPSPNQGLVRPVGPGEFPYLSPDYSVINLRAGYDTENIQVILYVQNLADEEYYTGTQENFGASGIRLRPHPRTVGISVGYMVGGAR